MTVETINYMPLVITAIIVIIIMWILLNHIITDNSQRGENEI